MDNENKKKPSKEIIEEEYRLGKEYYNKLLNLYKSFIISFINSNF